MKKHCKTTYGDGAIKTCVDNSFDYNVLFHEE